MISTQAGSVLNCETFYSGTLEFLEFDPWPLQQEVQLVFIRVNIACV